MSPDKDDAGLAVGGEWWDHPGLRMVGGKFHFLVRRGLMKIKS